MLKILQVSTTHLWHVTVQKLVLPVHQQVAHLKRVQLVHRLVLHGVPHLGTCLKHRVLALEILRLRQLVRVHPFSKLVLIVVQGHRNLVPTWLHAGHHRHHQ
uniref:(northern house mosquito) hypothetical protein n=1 Tax=Culex pipiens TaxID=7175 RepID=A0A8D8FQX7_CULPI